jgi:hypothetical protein
MWQYTYANCHLLASIRRSIIHPGTVQCTAVVRSTDVVFYPCVQAMNTRCIGLDIEASILLFHAA